MNTEKKERYYVLYTPTDKQTMVRNTLSVSLPGDRGLVFYPCMESYRRGKPEPDRVALFPGYIFIRSSMSLREIHDFVKQGRRELSTYIRELGFSDGLADESGADTIISDLSEEEVRFLDFLLGVNVDEETGDVAPPGDGLLRMSYGYREGTSFVVMQGPLKYYADRIKEVNIHNRKAYLDLYMRGRPVRAGFEIKPKKFWFPEEKEGVILEDGTEINVDELKHSMEPALARRRKG